LLLIVDIMRNGRMLVTFTKPLFAFMGIAFALRIGYIAYIMNDPPSDRITVLFIELPSMLYWVLASVNLIRWIRPTTGYGYDEVGCSHKCCLPKLKFFVMIILAVTVAAFIGMLVYILGNLGPTADPIGGSQLISEFAWFSFWATFMIIEIVWFLLMILCGICGASLELFEPSEQGDNTKNGMTCSVILSMVSVILVSVGQIILVARVFLWAQALFTWDISQAVGYMLLLDLFPGFLLAFCCILSPFQRGTVFRSKV